MCMKVNRLSHGRSLYIAAFLTHANSYKGSVLKISSCHMNDWQLCNYKCVGTTTVYSMHLYTLHILLQPILLTDKDMIIK